MTGPHDPRPWWASTPGEAADPDEDPLTRHRQARAGGAGGTDTGGAAGDAGHPGDAGDTGDPGGARDVPTWWAPAAEAVARLSQDLASTATANADAARGRAPWEDLDEPPARHDATRDPDRTRGPGHARAADGAGGPADAPHATGSRADEDAAAHLDVCGVCPICVGLRALGTHRPELVGHLAEAARHLAAAVRNVVEAATEPPSPSPPAGADGGLTRIDLDDLGDRDGRDGGDPTQGPEGG